MIPIQNIYFLLCYAWDTLDERGMVCVQQDECKTYVDLFARILESGVSHLLKRGLDRGYITEAEDTTCPRGKVDVSTTIKHNCLQHARLHCLFDTFSHDVLHNRIIKTTMGRLVRCESLAPVLRDRLLGVYRRLHDVSPVDLNATIFSRVTLHRNNAFYGFLLHVCRLIYDNLLVDEKTGKAKFRDFLRDDKAMARLFERFVYNFFRREQTTFDVKREKIGWQDVVADEESLEYLPEMKTDVSLISSKRHIVLDTKYTADILAGNFGSEKLTSEHMYQIFAYIKNVQVMETGDGKVEGILLYPTVSKALDLTYQLHGHRFRVATLDLNSHWKEITHRLLGLLN